MDFSPLNRVASDLGYSALNILPIAITIIAKQGKNG
jgi:hypothetical protein